MLQSCRIVIQHVIKLIRDMKKILKGLLVLLCQRKFRRSLRLVLRIAAGRRKLPVLTERIPDLRIELHRRRKSRSL